LFISEVGTGRIRRVDAATGAITSITTFAGAGSSTEEDILAAMVQILNPRGITTDLEGNLFITELSGHRIRAVRLSPVTLSHERLKGPGHGEATIAIDGTLTYTPQRNFNGPDVLQFRAIDGLGRTSLPAEFDITVAPVADLPIADAGSDRTVNAAVPTTLDGSGSVHPDGTPITFSWRLTSRPQGSAAALGSSTTVNPTFTPDLSGTYIVELTVTDGLGATSSDSVTITAVLPVLQTAMTVLLQYRDRSGTTVGAPSATGAAYWIEGALINNQTQRFVADLGRIEDTKTVYDVPAGSYRLRLTYGPGSGSASPGPEASTDLSPIQFTPSPVTVQLGQLATVSANVSNALGEIEGGVTLNGGAPGAGLAVCVTSTENPARFALWCMNLAPTGTFNLLLPVGRGQGRICLADIVAQSGQCGPAVGAKPNPRAEPPLGTFDFDVRAGETRNVTPVNIVAGGVSVLLQYRDRSGTIVGVPSVTGAAYWIEGALINNRGVVVTELGRIEDTKTVYDVPPGSYRVRLTYGSVSGKVNPSKASTELSPVQFTPSPVTVQLGQLVTVTATVSEAVGEIEGGVTLNGGAPGAGLAVCVTSTENPARFALWCMNLAPTGTFNLLLPVGRGQGSVCSADIVAENGGCEVIGGGRPRPKGVVPLATFDFTVSAGQTSGVTPR
jgi:hypothetical protein